MKLKLTIALVILALVLGMVLAACDDGEVQTITETKKKVTINGVETEVVTDAVVDTGYVPYIDGNEKDPPANGTITGETGDTTGLEKPTSGF
jgi:hypothetical protein